MLHRFWFVIVLSLTMFAVSSCGNGSNKTGTPAAAVKSISVSPGSTTILMGKQQQFSVTATYSDGSTKSAPAGITWTSSNTAVATVDSSGLVKGVAPGNVTISAAVGSVNGSSSTKVQTVLATLDRSTDVPGPDKDGNGVRDNSVSTALACVWTPGVLFSNGVTRWSKVPFAVAATRTTLSFRSASYFPSMMSAIDQLWNVCLRRWSEDSGPK